MEKNRVTYPTFHLMLDQNSTIQDKVERIPTKYHDEHTSYPPRHCILKTDIKITIF